MRRQLSILFNLFARYLVIVLLGLGNLYFFYKILTPLTVNTVTKILSLFSEVTITHSTLYLDGLTIEMIPACIAGAAFYLLTILVFSTPNLKPRIRFLALFTSLLFLFILNVLRIIILISIAGTLYFNAAHWIFWHLVSTIFIVAIWIAVIRMYNIKGIPVLSDLEYLYSLIDARKNTQRGKKNNNSRNNNSKRNR